MKQDEIRGEIVKFNYKTGEYIGEAIERDERRTLVKTLAVLRHPTQGDLHSAYDPDAPIFHERRALAYTEKVWVPTQAARPYEGRSPDYRESLKTALAAEIERIDRMRRWADRCSENLATLRGDYRLED